MAFLSQHYATGRRKEAGGTGLDQAGQRHISINKRARSTSTSVGDAEDGPS